MNKEIKTKIYTYNYDISIKKDKKAYKEELKKAKEKTGFSKPDTLHYINFVGLKGSSNLREFHKSLSFLNEVTIEAEYLFNNQFNIKEGNERVFLWQEYIYENPNIKKGYYLEMTEELKKALNETFKCGFCGKYYTKEEKEKKGLTFCDSCLDSEYLEENQLFLLRLKRINDKTSRISLNDCDKSALIKIYRESQIYGENERGKERTKQAYLKIKNDYEKEKLNNEIEYKGKKWLLDNKVPKVFYDDVIFYSHSGKWRFGWSNKLNFEQEQELKTYLVGFPFNYEIEVQNDLSKM